MYFPDATIGFHYVFLDVNGDGLVDAVQVPNADGNTFAFPSPRIGINTGAGFTWIAGTSTNPNVLFNQQFDPNFDTGTRVGDIDQDGLPDIIFFGWAAGRNNVEVLTAAKQAASAPDPALVPGDTPKLTDGNTIPLPVVFAVKGSHSGYIPLAQVGNFNGDGLLDTGE